MSRTIELTFSKFTAPAFPQLHCLSSSPPQDITQSPKPLPTLSPYKPSTTTNPSLFLSFAPSPPSTTTVTNLKKKKKKTKWMNKTKQNFMLRKNKLLQQLPKHTKQLDKSNQIKSKPKTKQKNVSCNKRKLAFDCRNVESNRAK